MKLTERIYKTAHHVLYDEGESLRKALQIALADEPEPEARVAYRDRFVDGIRRTLAGAYADATQERIESLQAELRQVAARSDADAERIAGLEARLEAIQICVTEWQNGNQASRVMPRIAESMESWRR